MKLLIVFCFLLLLIVSDVIDAYATLQRTHVNPCCSPSTKYTSGSHDPEFDAFNQFLFNRFAQAVSKELRRDGRVPQTFQEMIDMICVLSRTEKPDTTSLKSKNMLVGLFPRGLLSAYKMLFSPFKTLSAWMNTWVTHFTTQWLMGPSTVSDLITPQGQVIPQSLLTIKKCKFLETSGCIRTCLFACKVPTEQFFNDEMGLPVALRPNFTDLSCRFEFGVQPLPVHEDLDIRRPCFGTCSFKKDLDVCT